MFDMRNFLHPKRLTIAMWDGAYMTRRNSGDVFANWPRVIDELLERGYNTVRIDAFPSIIDPNNLDLIHTWPDMHRPYMPWLWDRKYTTKPGRDLIEFLQLANRKGLNVTLSSWWESSDLRVHPKNADEATDLWIQLLDLIKREAGFDNIVFVDLCNEIPGFLPGYMKALDEAKFEKSQNSDHVTLDKPIAAAPPTGSSWNEHQLAFMRRTLDDSLAKAQEHFPELRFTYSMNMNTSFEQVGFQHLDVLDIHFFLTDERFDRRTGFNSEFIQKMFVTSEGFRNFSDRARATIASVGPMLRQKQREQLRWAKQFSDKIGAPLLTTEAWASWFYIDHPDLDWGWLLEWSEIAVDDAIEFGLWGMATNNYAEPMFELWKDVRWHRRLNERFLKG